MSDLSERLRAAAMRSKDDGPLLAEAVAVLDVEKARGDEAVAHIRLLTEFVPNDVFPRMAVVVLGRVYAARAFLAREEDR